MNHFDFACVRTFPLLQQAYSGNTADGKTCVEQWHHLIDLLGSRDFLFAGDSKVTTGL
jgi:hypothetical protein